MSLNACKLQHPFLCYELMQPNWIWKTYQQDRVDPAHTQARTHARTRTYNKIWLNWIEQVNLFCCYRFIIIWCVLLCEQCKRLPFLYVSVSKNEKQQANIFFWVTLCCCVVTIPHRTSSHIAQNTQYLYGTQCHVFCVKEKFPLPFPLQKYFYYNHNDVMCI